MSSLRALKRKSQQRQKNNKENSISCSLPNVTSINKRDYALKRSKSESDLRNLDIPSKKDLKTFHAKSERNLESLYSNFMTSTPHDTLNALASPTSTAGTIMNSSFSMITDQEQIKVPIVGYEVMEERSRFTIFKLRIENYEKNNFWLVLRRFTDFTRLHTKLRSLYPNVNLVLPKKKWFGNNFSSGFLDTRIAGLQTFINTILGNTEMRSNIVVREFFCLDDPPMYSESMEECKAIFEAQEETIAHMKMQLRVKDDLISSLSQELNITQQQNEYLTSLVKWVSRQSSFFVHNQIFFLFTDRRWENLQRLEAHQTRIKAWSTLMFSTKTKAYCVLYYQHALCLLFIFLCKCKKNKKKKKHKTKFKDIVNRIFLQQESTR